VTVARVPAPASAPDRSGLAAKRVIVGVVGGCAAAAVALAYLALTIGMTFQVYDTDMMSKRVRRVALHHALLSYLFGTVIVAITIGAVAGLLGQ
jgi:hypothetical protein